MCWAEIQSAELPTQSRICVYKLRRTSSIREFHARLLGLCAHQNRPGRCIWGMLYT